MQLSHTIKYIFLTTILSFLILGFTSPGLRQRPQEQEPEKDTLLIKRGKTYSTLTGLKGWAKTSKGKWASSNNRIPFYEEDYNNPMYYKYKLGVENMEYMRLINLVLNGKPYTALLIAQDKGYYKDEGETDFRFYKAVDYYLMDKDELLKLKPDSLPVGTPVSVSLRVRHAGTVPYYTDARLDEKIAKEINKVYSRRHLYDTTVSTWFQFALKQLKGDRGHYMRFNTSLAYSTGDKEPAPAPFYTFDYQYYELPFYYFRVFVNAALKD